MDALYRLNLREYKGSSWHRGCQRCGFTLKSDLLEYPWIECRITILVQKDINSLKLLVRVHWGGTKSEFFCLDIPVLFHYRHYHFLLHTLHTALSREWKRKHCLTQFSFVLDLTNRLWVHRYRRYTVDHIQCNNEKVIHSCCSSLSPLEISSLDMQT